MNKLIILVLFSIFLLSCQKQEQVIIAKVGSQKITLKEANDRIAGLSENYKSYLRTKTGQKQYIDLLVREKLVLEEARRQGIDKNKEIIDEVKRFKDNYKKRVEEYKQNLVVNKLMQELQDKTFTPSEQELRTYYNEHKKQFISPVEVSVSHILVSTKEEAEKIIKKLKNGEKFDELAKKYSIDPASNIYGGDLGKYRYGELLPEFETVVEKLNTGEISDVVKTAYGYHIIKITGRKILPTKKYEDAKEDIRKLIIKDKFDEWVEKKKKEFNVKINENISLAIDNPYTQMPLK